MDDGTGADGRNREQEQMAAVVTQRASMRVIWIAAAAALGGFLFKRASA